MRVLYVGYIQGFGNADKFYLIPQRMLNGLTRAGHNVYCFNDRDHARASNIFGSSKLGIGPMNRNLVKVCKDFYPDLIILAHCTHVKNETLEEIRSVVKNVKIIHRNVDPINDKGNVERIKDRTPYVDGIFITTAGPALQQFAGERAFAAFFPNPVDSSIDTGRAFEQSTYEADLFFAASSIGKDDHRQKLVTDIMADLAGTNVKFDIIGAGLNDRRLFGIDYMNRLAVCKTGLIANKTEGHYLYASDRMSQYLGNGLMVYAPVGPRYTDLFTPQEIVTYETHEDLAEKIKYYHSHDEERRKIAANGHAKAHKIFDTTLVAQYFIDMVYDRMEGKAYPWPSEKYILEQGSPGK
ncbi:MAG TPA: glycosyltransferase [Alphaproteobacteria bacterium]|nr:glycosyltransferase [Alphaproteobacteria bacterium]HNS44813.1 glycosyltransferase [Alphaproteobacteria bacterium]